MEAPLPLNAKIKYSQILSLMVVSAIRFLMNLPSKRFFCHRKNPQKLTWTCKSHFCNWLLKVKYWQSECYENLIDIHRRLVKYLSTFCLRLSGCLFNKACRSAIGHQWYILKRFLSLHFNKLHHYNSTWLTLISKSVGGIINSTFLIYV